MINENFIRTENTMDDVLRYDLREGLPEQTRSDQDYPWIVFDLDGTEYGINSKYVLSIEILGEVTPIVDSQPHCPGITQSRGDMIELLDLRALFSLGDYISAKPDSDDTRYMMVVVETDEKKHGVIVDEIVSVEYITQFIEGIVDESNRSVSTHYVSQIAKREKLGSPVLIIKPESISML